MRYWVGRGIVDIDTLRKKLVGPSAVAWREESQVAELGASTMGASGQASALEGAPTTCLLTQAMPLALDWMREEDELKRAVMRIFGYGDVYGWQREVVEALLAGRDTIVARHTGGGKSLCFQLPALVDSLRPRASSDPSAGGAMATDPYKTVVVVTPNVSLMVDQVCQINTRLRRLFGDDLSALGLARGREFAALLGSAQTDPSVARAAMAGEYRLLYITERLLFSSSSASSSASLCLPWVQALRALRHEGRLLLLAIDEAHVVIEWTESDFRGDYARLGELREALPGLPVLALSATPTPSMWQSIRQTLRIAHAALVSRGSIYRPNLVLRVKIKAESGKPGGALVEELQPLVDELVAEASSPSGAKATIIYTHRIGAVDKIRAKLEAMLSSAQQGQPPSQTIRVGSYHGGEKLRKRDDESARDFTQRKVAHEEARLRERESTQLQFIQGRISVVVANEAFGMGINHPHIRRVIEYGSPKLLEQLLNHFGRAGRDGEESICTLICKPQDFNVHEAHINHDAQMGTISGPTQQRQRGSLDQLRAYAENVSTCRWRFLLAHWQEDSVLADAQWSCGKCDNCRGPVGSGAPSESENFNSVALLLLVMLQSAAVSVSRPSVRWDDMKRGLARGGGMTQLARLRAQVDGAWNKSVWTQTRLRHMLSVLSELPVPLVHRSNSMKKGFEGFNVPNEQYSLMDAGRELLALYERGEPLPDLILPIPLFLLQRHSKSAKCRHVGEEGGSGDDGPTTDSEREDLLEDGQRVVKKGSETLYIPQSVVGERRVAGGRLEYRIRWQKWHDLSWEDADRRVSPGSHSTWRDTPVVADWEAAKRSGSLLPHVCLQLKLGPWRRGVAIGTQLNVVLMPATSTPLSAPADPMVAEERAATRRAAQEKEAAEVRLAQAAIARVPWAVRFAIMACDASEASRPNIEMLARDSKGRDVLAELSEASGQAAINHITTRHRLPRLRVPSVDTHSALIYAVVVGLSASASASASTSASVSAGVWAIIRYEGPFRRSVTKASRSLGCANLLLVKIEDGAPQDRDDVGTPQRRRSELEQLQTFLLGFHDVCGRQFAYMLHKVEHQKDTAQLLMVSVGPSVVRASTPAAAHWSCTGGTVHSWATAAEARALLADFEVLPVPKMAKRMQLLLSPTMRCLDAFTLQIVRDAPGGRLERLLAPSDAAVVQVVEVDDLFSAASGDVASKVMTEGCGRISSDLARHLPPLENGSPTDKPMAARMAADESAPLVSQARLWYAGCVAKGLWLTDATLPERTILVGRQTQRKLEAREACAAARCGSSSFEVIRTFGRLKRVRLDVYLIPILEVAAGVHRERLHELILLLQAQLASKYLAMGTVQLSRAVRRQRTMEVIEDNEMRRAGASLLRLTQAGFDPLSEPYLQLELAKLSDEAVRGLKAGKLPLPDSYTLPGMPDFTGSLAPGEICVVVNGHALPRPMGLREGEAFEVLVYGSPGMHPGDLHKVSVSYPEALRQMICASDPSRSHGVFFSTRGDRSLADMIAGGDFDGDEYSVIAWRELVQLCVQMSPPYTAEAAPLPQCCTSKAPSASLASAATSEALACSSSAATASTSSPTDVTGGVRSAELFRPTRGVIRQSEQAAQRRVEQRLLANYIMSRFMSGSLVGTAGTQWMVFADRFGAASRPCLQLDHLYRLGLDAIPPDTATPTSFGPHMPTGLCLNEYPEHMKGKADEKNARAAQHASASSGCGGRTVSLVASKESLLAKLWHAVLCSPSGELAPIHVDPDLSRARWPRCPDVRTGTAAYDDHYVRLWSERYEEYARRERELRGERGEGTPIEDDDPYWEQYREIVAEYRALLYQSHTEWERLMSPQELYAEVAAMYEVCYKAAHLQQLQQRRTIEGSQQVGAPSASAVASAPALRQPGTGRIRFPWRIANQQLLEMKEKARQLAQGESLR